MEDEDEDEDEDEEDEDEDGEAEWTPVKQEPRATMKSIAVKEERTPRAPSKRRGSNAKDGEVSNVENMEE